MRFWIRAAAMVAALVAITPATAQSTRLRVNGTISNISALQNSVAISTPSGSIHVGDAYSLEATFDRSVAQLTSTFDADPTVNIYYLPGTTVSLQVGNYSRSFSPSYSGNSSVQIWNNYDISGRPVDAQSFDFFDYDAPGSKLPFDLGAGRQSLSIDSNNFDFTAAARSNDLISQIAPLSAFASKSFSIGQLNSDTNVFVYTQGQVTSAVLEDLSAPQLNLTGATVTASLLYPGMSFYSGGGSAIVGSGVEFQPGFFTRAGDAAPQSIDVGANSISLFTNAAATYSTSDFNGFRLDFSNYAGSLADLAIAPTSTFQPTSFRVDGNSVYINVSGKTVRANDVLVLAAVPEPGTWATLIIGFSAVGGTLRVRRRTALAIA